ncbi:heavy metal translocating P-type ATPase [Scytonema hofmannii]|nr:heavy metal translocating P-type ATPase [Scytonema hofmannii]
MSNQQTLEVVVNGMDCADCARHVQQAIGKLPGVKSVDALWSSKKAVVRFDSTQVDEAAIHKAVETAGYSILTPTVEMRSELKQQTLEVAVNGMDCADCARHVQQAIGKLPGVESVDVFLSSKKAVVRLDPTQVDITDIRSAVIDAGYSLATETVDKPKQQPLGDFTRTILVLFGVVFGAVLFITVVGERLGLFEALTKYVPWPIGLAIVLIGGYPIFRNVIRTTLKGRITSHTLMTLGVIAALAVAEWATAAVVVFFMYIGEYAEKFTAERARRAVKDLTAMAPQMARVERNGVEQVLPVSEVRVGETVIVRPGDKIPVDGEVISGQATVDQAAITGESIPVEVGSGANVFAATLASLGSLRIRATHVGADTTFGRVIKLVQEAEMHRSSVQRIADKFSAYFLPIVIGIATLTFVVRRDPLATAAVLVVACSCSLALATPIAMLASIGAGAKRGLLIKGGKYLEVLDRADVLLIDKTGTLTLGRPQITDVIPLRNISESELLQVAASAERYSEHPLALAVRNAAQQSQLTLHEPINFVAVPGMGVRAQVNSHAVTVGNRRMLHSSVSFPIVDELEAQGKTLLFVTIDDKLTGILAAADTLRAEVPGAIAAVNQLGVRHIELLTGDNERTAAAVAERLGVSYRANLLPEDKIAIVKSYQAKGHTVVMVGDGVNDAPALAQADVGIAMGAAGTDVAIEAAHVALLREDWTLIPELFKVAYRTMYVVKGNIAFTALYNLVGLLLAALGFLPPIVAAAAQSLPDLGILANSSRLLRIRSHH